jgi:hypothetical protein
MKKREILFGERFNKLTFLYESERIKNKSCSPHRVAVCLCDCGKEKKVRMMHLFNGTIKSCGCSKGKHHSYKTKLYRVWCSMRRRCEKRTNETTNKSYYNKGIFVCNEWNDFLNFEKWAKETGYNSTLQIDRIDNSKGYSPENCRWVCPITNMNNRDNTVFVFYNGEKKALMNVLREKGLEKHYVTIWSRIKKNWDIHKAIDTPIRKFNTNF